MNEVAVYNMIVALLLVLLLGTAITVARMRDLWAAVMLTGIYSFLGASWMLLLDAPDVAFTEAAVGAGIATFLMLGTLALTSRKAKESSSGALGPLTVVVVTGAALVYGTFDMPRYGDPRAPVHQHVAPEYLNDNVPHVDHGKARVKVGAVKVGQQESTAAPTISLEITESAKASKVDVPNIVTAVLASYRGYDTLGETVVIFTAGIGVLLLLRGRRRSKNREESA